MADDKENTGKAIADRWAEFREFHGEDIDRNAFLPMACGDLVSDFAYLTGHAKKFLGKAASVRQVPGAVKRLREIDARWSEFAKFNALAIKENRELKFASREVVSEIEFLLSALAALANGRPIPHQQAEVLAAYADDADE